MNGPAPTYPVEPKVKAQAIYGYVAGVLCLGAIDILSNGPFLISAIPSALQVFVLPFIPGLIGLLGGYAAKHQWRGTEEISSSS